MVSRPARTQQFIAQHNCRRIQKIHEPPQDADGTPSTVSDDGLDFEHPFWTGIGAPPPLEKWQPPQHRSVSVGSLPLFESAYRLAGPLRPGGLMTPPVMTPRIMTPERRSSGDFTSEHIHAKDHFSRSKPASSKNPAAHTEVGLGLFEVGPPGGDDLEIQELGKALVNAEIDKDHTEKSDFLESPAEFMLHVIPDFVIHEEPKVSNQLSGPDVPAAVSEEPTSTYTPVATPPENPGINKANTFPEDVVTKMSSASDPSITRDTTSSFLIPSPRALLPASTPSSPRKSHEKHHTNLSAPSDVLKQKLIHNVRRCSGCDCSLPSSLPRWGCSCGVQTCERCALLLIGHPDDGGVWGNLEALQAKLRGEGETVPVVAPPKAKIGTSVGADWVRRMAHRRTMDSEFDQRWGMGAAERRGGGGM